VWQVFHAVFCPGCGKHHDLAIEDRDPLAPIGEFAFICPADGRSVTGAGASVGFVRFSEFEPPNAIVARGPGATAGERNAADRPAAK